MTKRVETWENKIYKANLSELELYTEEDESVIVCLSPLSRNILLDIVSFELHWARRWMLDKAAGPGSVLPSDFIPIVEQIERELIMTLGCGSDLTRIADATESMATTIAEWYDSQYISILELKPLIMALPFGEELWAASDLAGELFEAIGLLPDIGIDIKLPIQDWWKTLWTDPVRHRQQIERLNDLIAATHGVGVGTAGPSVAAVIEQYLDDIPGLSLIDRLMGNLDESIIRAAGLDIPTLLSGNYMTNKTDDVRNALNGGIIPSVGYNVTQKIDQLTASIQALGLSLIPAITGALGSIDGCGCVTIGPDDVEEIGEPVDIGVGDPPGDFTNWGDYSSAKCQLVNKLVEEIITLIERSAGVAQGVQGFAIAAVITIIVGLVTGVGVLALIGIALTVGSVALGVYGSLAKMMVYFGVNIPSLHGELVTTHQQVVCELQLAGSPTEARGILVNWFMDAATEVSSNSEWLEYCQGFIEGIGQNALLNGVFLADLEIDPGYIAPFDCTECTPTGAGQFTLTVGTGTILYTGQNFNISSQPDGGLHRITMLILEEDAVDFGNWCVQFNSRTSMNNSNPPNYNRRVWANGATYMQYFRDYDSANTSGAGWPGAGNKVVAAQIDFINNASFTLNLRIDGPYPALGPTDNIDTACD